MESEYKRTKKEGIVQKEEWFQCSRKEERNEEMSKGNERKKKLEKERMD